MKRALGAAAALVLAVAGLAGCEVGSTVARPAQPAVLTGADLPGLVGEEPGDIVAFRHTRKQGDPTWTQIPVQVDERAVVPFGTHPSSNSMPGLEGTVYGNGGGATALQYTDPETFVGPDPDPTFDADDELVFMISDAGGAPRDGDDPEPAGVVGGSGVAVRVDDPHGGTGWVHLFVRSGGLDPSAGQDYVDYDFRLTSGDYRTTYRRASGPNPETSVVTTPSYRIAFTDRWYEVDWQVASGGSTGPDLLDGHKNQFALGSCGRSNLTFAHGEGAFVANIDGPVRAIRSYVGANSGPKTQRTHFLYRDQEIIRTDLRVHAIPSILDFVDYGPGAVGMTYRSSTAPGGATIDGVPDAVGSDVATWEAVHGSQGTVITAARFATTAPGLTTSWLHRDQASPPETQCWGDASFLGASGAAVTGGIANTDPATPPYATLTATRVVTFLPPTDDGEVVTTIAAALADDLDQPVEITTAPYQP